MKFKLLFTMLAVCLFSASCGSDDENEVVPAREVAGVYEGYSSATFAYSPTPMVINDESVTISANEDGTARLVLTSNQWGTTTAEALSVVATSSGYALSGTGTSAISSHGGTANEYACTISGTISNDKNTVALTFSLDIMGGTTITFRLGDAPMEEYLPGTYDGYSSAEFAYSPTPMVTDDENIVIAVDDNGTWTLTFTSQTWGTTTVADLQVSQDGSGNFLLLGDGVSLMGMGGTTSEYPSTVTGTIAADKSAVDVTISLQVMGGTTITFHLGEAPEA